MIRLASLALLTALLCDAAVDLRKSSIELRSNASPIEKKAAAVIAQEIEKRTQLRISVGATGSPLIRLVIKGGGAAEGFTVTTTAQGITITGNDTRGIIFGAGYFLRQLTMSRQRLEIAEGLNITSAPKVPIRGHQLGYRPKTNAYDGWSVPMWEQYIRELAIFGTNTIELIPPRSDDAPDSPHFPLPQKEMKDEM